MYDHHGLVRYLVPFYIAMSRSRNPVHDTAESPQGKQETVHHHLRRPHLPPNAVSLGGLLQR